MKRNILVAVLSVSLAGGVALGYWLAQLRVPRDDAADAAPAQSKDGRRILYWHDPMNPNVKFDKPGKSPFMDMPLVPVYAAEQSEGPAVRVDPGVTQSLGIRLGKVERTALQPHLAAVGSVAYDERLLHVVQARVEGYVIRLRVKAPLEPVRRGQPLADILAPAWLAAQEEYLALLDAESVRARSIRDAARARLVVLGVPEETIRKLERERKADATTTIFAPADGVVTELAVREGATFMPGEPLFRINGLESVWTNAEVPEAQVAMVTRGSSVTARATGWPGIEFEGRVAALLPQVEPATRTLPVRIVIRNPERKLVPGMFVAIDFAGAPGEPQLVVPSEAVIVTGERSVVVIAREGGGFDVADVTIGTEEGGRTAILSGLAEGQSVVLSGQFLIDSEASLKSSVTRLETEAAPAQKQP